MSPFGGQADAGDPLKAQRDEIFRRLPASSRSRCQWHNWAPVGDLDLCAIVVDVQPQIAPHGKTAEAWATIAARMQAAHPLYTAVQARAAQDRFNILLAKYKATARVEEGVSGDPIVKSTDEEKLDSYLAECVKVCE